MALETLAQLLATPSVSTHVLKLSLSASQQALRAEEGSVIAHGSVAPAAHATRAVLLPALCICLRDAGASSPTAAGAERAVVAELTRLMDVRRAGAGNATGVGAAAGAAVAAAAAAASGANDDETEKVEEADEEEGSDWDDWDDEEESDEREEAGPRLEEVGRFLWWLCEPRRQLPAPHSIAAAAEAASATRRKLLLEAVASMPAADGALLLQAMRCAPIEIS